VNFNEKLVIYPNEVASGQAYEQWHKEVFSSIASNKQQVLSGTDYLKHADQAEFVCLPMSIDRIPHLACQALARYQNIIVAVRGTVLEDRILTMPDFQAILTAVDRRFATMFKQK
jgi:hypothetical protein